MEKPDFKIIEADDVISSLKTLDVLENLFPRDPDLEHQLAEDMRSNGFDYSKPIDVWRRKASDGSEELITVDGHTRRNAAIEAHVSVSIVEKEFADENEAIRFAYRCQLKRRNLTPAQIMVYIQKFQDLSSRQIAKELKISPSTAQRMRKILQKGGLKLQKAVKEGEKSVYAAAEEMREVPTQPQGQKEQPESVDAAHDTHEAEELRAVPSQPLDETEQAASPDATREEEEEQEEVADEEKRYVAWLHQLVEDVKSGKRPEAELDREVKLSNYTKKEIKRIERTFRYLEGHLDFLFEFDEQRLMGILRKWLEKHPFNMEVA